MPIPLIPVIIGAGTALFGVGKSIKAGMDMSEAKDVNRRANDIIDSAKNNLELARKKSSESLNALGEKKLFILDNSIKIFIKNFEKLQNVDFTNSEGLDELDKFIIDKQSFAELKEMSNYAASILGGISAGAVGGALTAFGAYSAATMFATASTGTAIATLSGVAATNATLAFFGGGSIAAGGLGMSAGAMVLGGLVAGPALAILGLVAGSKASKLLDDAYSNLAQARKVDEELKTMALACHAVRRRAVLFYRLLVRLEIKFVQLNDLMETVIESEGTDFKLYPVEQKKKVASAASMAKAIKSVLDTPILTEDGKLTDESNLIAAEIGAKIS